MRLLEIKGYYALQDYTVQYWFDHFRECAESTAALDLKEFQEVTQAAQVFLDSYGNLSKMGEYYDTRSPEGVARVLKKLPEDGSKRNEYFNIEVRTTSIRNAIETLHGAVLDRGARDCLINLHGVTTPYKCAKPWCESFTAGFGSSQDRQRHTNRHDLPFGCPIEGCFAFELRYDTKEKLDRHKKSHHRGSDDGVIKFPKRKQATNIWSAAERGDLVGVKTLLDSGADVNQLHKKGRLGGSPLHLAAESGRYDVCKMLLERGASINLGRRLVGRTALHEAAAAGNVDIVHLLVSQEECEPDITDNSGRSPFDDACELGRLDVVKLLFATGKIQNGLLPNHNGVYDSMSTPLGYACSGGHTAVVQYLLQQGQSALADEKILERAATAGHKALVDLLLPAMGIELPRTRLGNDWLILFNPAVSQVLDVELVHALHSEYDGVNHVQFSSDGRYLATTCWGFAQINDVTTGEKLCTLQHPELSAVGRVCFSPDGKYLVAAGQSIAVWDIAMRTVSRTLRRNDHSLITSLDFADDGHTIAFADGSATLHLWDFETSTDLMLRTNGSVYAVAISPGSKFVAEGSSDNCPQVWDVQSGDLVADLGGPGGHQGGVSSIAFSPDGSKLISGSYDGTIKIWELGTLGEIDNQRHGEGRCITTFKGHKKPLYSVAFTPDARWVVSSSYGGDVKLWDPHTGQTQLTLWGHEGDSSVWMASSATGGYFATAGYDKIIRIWSYARVNDA
ncbi:WD40-repeat-containing domain protein [Durotheca rogersii]|uniref:WD40-repeat-containing domain protein n=1 Tax=Durotheca rogersii TaxID=419775 RepID=UPI00221ED938|nr:WD40-repeat-containing domain protein [Durotheca rogersii]KAI5861651.1 WD40-repeat-containing domain protein [Durotheca rogersii]